MTANDLLPALIRVSEKAGNIARICRQDEHLLSYLIQEKKEGEKNPRFLTDFKTLADVLVQELVKHDLCSKFPCLQGNIYGEENNEFLSEGETIIVEVKPEELETSQLLFKVLNDEEASNTLARVIHSDVEDNVTFNVEGLPELPKSIGIWIDPIDATSEYIQGGRKEEHGLVTAGLPCVTVLIGVFDMETGSPIIGVINQPFYLMEDSKWSGRYVYGLSFGGVKISNPEFSICCSNAVAVSSSEKEEIKKSLTERGYSVLEIAGAGYKLLNIVTGMVKAYVLSKPTSYLWDICACNAILESIGGGIIDYSNLSPIKYKAGQGVDNCCNSGGILAYRSQSIKDDIIHILKLHSLNHT